MQSLPDGCVRGMEGCFSFMEKCDLRGDDGESDGGRSDLGRATASCRRSLLPALDFALRTGFSHGPRTGACAATWRTLPDSLRPPIGPSLSPACGFPVESFRRTHRAGAGSFSSLRISDRPPSGGAGARGDGGAIRRADRPLPRESSCRPAFARGGVAESAGIADASGDLPACGCGSRSEPTGSGTGADRARHAYHRRSGQDLRTQSQFLLALVPLGDGDLAGPLSHDAADRAVTAGVAGGECSAAGAGGGTWVLRRVSFVASVQAGGRLHALGISSFTSGGPLRPGLQPASRIRSASPVPVSYFTKPASPVSSPRISPGLITCVRPT